MKKFLLGIAVCTAVNSFSQFITDFEYPVFGVADSAWFGQDQTTDGDTIYTNGFTTMELNYNSTWQSFSGWAVSSWTDTITQGYSNQFSAITGQGDFNSDQYGVCYVSQWSNNRLFLDNYLSQQFNQMSVTNTAYAYWSMKYGDAFAKPFGADTSAAGVPDGTNGEDWFLLTIYALGVDSLQTGDSINFYLADYTFADSTQDYIVDSWEVIDLQPLYLNGSDIIGLDFVLSSSDTSGGFGMNTPAYFAMDHLTVDYTFGYEENSNLQLETYPNPANEDLRINTEINAVLELYDLNGRLILQKTATSQQLLWDLSEIQAGMYTLVATLDDKRSHSKIIIQH